MSLRTFKSDNYSGVHPEVMAALSAVNEGHAPAYMNDAYSEETTRTLRDHFCADAEVLYCFNGTGANVLALRACLKPYQSVLCASTSHLHQNETGAPESILGTKLVLLPHEDGKMRAADLRAHLATGGNGIHSPQPKVVSITQSTECGTCYSREDLLAIKEVCLEHDLFLHMDGCRLYNAAAYLRCSLAEISHLAGVDILSLGGTKNGAMIAEAVLVFNPHLFEGLRYLQKNTLQLCSKNRFIAAQFSALFSERLWFRNADHANAMAAKLAARLEEIPGVSLAHPVETNQLFVQLPMGWCRALEEKGYGYVFSHAPPTLRLVCSFDTEETEMDLLIQDLQGLAAGAA